MRCSYEIKWMKVALSVSPAAGTRSVNALHHTYICILKTPLCTHLFHLAESAIINNNQIITRRGVFRAFISARQPLVLLSGAL
jgi:hypothetical protein